MHLSEPCNFFLLGNDPANTGRKKNILKTFWLVCRVFLPFKKRFFNVRCLLGCLAYFEDKQTSKSPETMHTVVNMICFKLPGFSAFSCSYKKAIWKNKKLIKNWIKYELISLRGKTTIVWKSQFLQPVTDVLGSEGLPKTLISGRKCSIKPFLLSLLKFSKALPLNINLTSVFCPLFQFRLSYFDFASTCRKHCYFSGRCMYVARRRWLRKTGTCKWRSQVS